MNSFRFCFSGKLFICHFFMKGSFVGYISCLAGYIFFFQHFKYIITLSFFWPARFLLRYLLTILWNFPCMWWVTFLFLALRILSLTLIITYLSVDFVFFLDEIIWVFLHLDVHFLSRFGKFLPFFLKFSSPPTPSVTPIMCIL